MGVGRWRGGALRREGIMSDESNNDVGWRLQTRAARFKLYEFLAAPAHIWLWLCARVCGMRFELSRGTPGGTTREENEISSNEGSMKPQL